MPPPPPRRTDWGAAASSQLLQRYHADPGQTLILLGRFRDGAGRTSYERMVAEVAGWRRSARVLDVGCGDGHLLSLLANEGEYHLVGVDQSSAELAVARERFRAVATPRSQATAGLPRVALHMGDAGSLPCETGSVDVVLCHMALMLFSPSSTFLGEAARVLTPSGWFSAVVNRPLRDPAYDIYRHELHQITTEAGMERLRLGDARVYSAEGLRELLAESGFLAESVETTEFDVRFRGPPRELWSALERMYDVFHLPVEARAELGLRLVRRWSSLQDGHGQLTCALGMRSVRARALTPVNA